jgi:hypothetical protein
VNASPPGESPLFEPLVYLVASARDCLDGPIVYAALRMVESVSRLVEAAEPDDDFLRWAREEIEREKDGVMADREQFVAWLDHLLERFAAEAKRRNVAG